MNILGNANLLKSANTKGKALSVALILLLAISGAVAFVPLIKAQVNTYTYSPSKGTNGLWNIPTFAGITAAPDPVGVGQPVQIIMIIELLPPSQGVEASTGVTGGWQGFSLTITDPTGNTTNLGPFESDVSGTYQVTYTPSSTGTYTFAFNFPGEQVDNTHNQGTVLQYWANFLPSNATTTLTVQQTQLTGFNEAPVPLPTQYWYRPINAQNRAWNSISGPWIVTGYNSTGAFNPYTYAPQSAHILWDQPAAIMQEGLVGGQYGSLPFGGTSGVTGTLYPEYSAFQTPIIMGGYVYYNSPYGLVTQGLTQGNAALTNQANPTFSCMNLQTGQVVYTVPGTFNYGQIVDWRSQQQRLTIGYLWYISSGSYKLYDPSTGALLAQWGNLAAGTKVATGTGAGFSGTTSAAFYTPSAVTVYSGTVVEEEPNPGAIGQDIGGASGGGALLVYIYGYNAGAATGWLACWNSTSAINAYNQDPTVWNFLSPADFPSTTSQLTTPLDWEFGIMWNVTVPLTTTTTATGTNAPASWSICGADQNYVILQTAASNSNATGTEYRTMAAINVAAIPMTTTYTVDVGGNYQHVTAGTFAWIENYSIPALDQTYPGGAVLMNAGNIIVTDNSVLAVWDFSETTGALLWTSTPFNNDFAMQGTTGSYAVAYGLLYNPGYDGYMHAISTANGTQVWDSITQDGGLEMPEPGYPARGTLIAGSNINNGIVFTSTYKSYETQPAYRGHLLIGYNAATGTQAWNISGEFTISSAAVSDGVLMAFNMYDGKEYAFAPGQTATTVSTSSAAITAGQSVVIKGTVTDQTPQFKGQPAISDQWMTPWMEYLTMNQPYPTQATGVQVSVDAIDPNGNYVHLGNATSDLTGMYKFTWTPQDIPGTYTIISTFSSDNSYYGSCAETAAYVVSPTTTTSPTATPSSVADMYFVPAIAGLFVLIIVVAIVLALLMLRKHA